MSAIDCIEIKKMTKEQNYIRGYNDGRADAIDKYTCKSDCEYGGTCEMCVRWDKLADCYEPPRLL